MDRNDQQAIESLFGKLAEVERQSPPRDADSEAFIRERIARQPGAPYYLAQTVVVQEQALEAAQARIEQLEAQISRAPQSSGGGLLGNLFGDTRPPSRSTGSVPRAGRPGGHRAAATRSGAAAAAGRRWLSRRRRSDRIGRDRGRAPWERACRHARRRW
jgi:uncharacterized protein